MNDNEAFNKFVHSIEPTGGLSHQQLHSMFLGWTAALAHRDTELAARLAAADRLAETVGEVIEAWSAHDFGRPDEPAELHAACEGAKSALTAYTATKGGGE